MSPLQSSTMGVIEAGLNPTIFRLFSKPDFKNYGLGGNPLERSTVSILYQSCPRIKSIVMDFSYAQCTWTDCHEYVSRYGHEKIVLSTCRLCRMS